MNGNGKKIAQIMDVMGNEETNVMSNTHHIKNLHFQGVLDIFVILVLAMGTSCSPLPTSASHVSQSTPITLSTPLATSTAMVISKGCFPLLNLEQSKSLIQGRLLFSRSDLKKNVTLDIYSMNEETLSDWLDSLQVSPDGNTLAIGNRESHTVSVVSREKTVNYSMPREDFWNIDDFLPDGRIILTLGKEPRFTDRYVENSGYTDEFYTMAVETGETAFHSLFLPYYIASGSHADSFFKYSSDLRYVIYSASRNGYRTILFDTKSNKIIWEGAGIGTPGVANGVVFPIWRPKTHEATLIYDSGNDQPSNENFYSLSINGSLSKLTQIEKFIQVPYQLRFPSWSPDGRFLAFIIYETNGNESLGFFDSHQNALITPCYSNTIGKSNRFLWDDMVWSPDGQYLAITKRAGDLEYEIYIFNLYDEIVYRQFFKTNEPGLLSLIGWLNWDVP